MSAVANDSNLTLGDSSEGNAPVKDRLTTTVFLAALFHGIVILGVTFAVQRPAPSPAATLEVLLLTGEDTDAADNLSAEYLAQRNQTGNGTTEDQIRPENPSSSPLPMQQIGIVDGNGTEYRENVTGQQSAEFITSRSDQNEVPFRNGEDRPSQQAETPLALAATSPSPIARDSIDMSLRLRGRQDGQYEIIPNTRESKIAPYLDAWRQKIERLGTLNFPQVARQQAAPGNPVLEVAIKADGSLSNIIVRRSSGRKEIDQAAQSILRLASPFDPFPTELRKQYDELRFAYEWQFLEGGGSRGSISVPASDVRPN